MKRAPKNMVITGPLHVGKSTLVRRVLAETPVSFHGIFTNRIIQDRRVVGYTLCDENGLTSVPFAHQDFPKTSQLNRFGYKPEVFEQTGVQLCRRTDESVELFVIDEIGIMEQDSPNYLKEILLLFDSSLPVLAVVQKRAAGFLQLLSQRDDVIVFSINRENRNDLPNLIRAHLRILLGQ